MADYDNVLFKSEVVLKKVLVEKNGCDFILICCGDYDLFIYNFNGLVNSRKSWSRPKLTLQSSLDSNVVDLVSFERKVYVALEDGSLLRIEATGREDEDDIFVEESPQTEVVTSWHLIDICSLPGSPKILSAASCKLGLLLLAKLQNTLSVFIVRNQIITSYTLEEECYINSGSTCVLNISNLSFDFMNLWLSHVERSEEFLVVALTSGFVYCLPLALPLKHYSVYTSVHSIVTVNWFQDRQSQRFDALVLVLDSGAVVRLTPVGEEVSFPFLPCLSKAVAVKNCVLTLNEINSRFLLLSDQSNLSKILPISQITSACSTSIDSKYLLICDNDCNLHFVNSMCFESLNESIDIRKSICDPLPYSKDLKKLIAASEQLEQVNRTLKTLDEYLRAKSLIARADILKKHFKLTIKIIQVLDDKHTIRFKLNFNLGGIMFSKDFWKLDITICTTSSNLSYQKDLLHNISNDRDLIQLITLPIKFDLIYDFDCKLVCYVESKNIELYLPIGKVEMNAGHFLFPISLKELCLTSDDNLWNDDTNKYFVNLDIPESKDASVYLSELLKESKALWRQSEWKSMLKNETASCVLFGHEIDIKIINKQLNIESNNLKACQAVKFAVLMKINSDSVKEHLAQCLMGWNQAENIIRLNDESKNHLSDVYNIVKSDTLISSTTG